MLLAIEESLSELKQWMPWAQTMPTEEDLTTVLGQGKEAFERDHSWEYALFERGTDDLLGCAGVHRTDVPGRFSVGYWIRTTRTREGLATAATRTLIEAVFECREEARSIVITMDEANAASAAIPQKLGFRIVSYENREITAQAHTGRGLVWVLDRQEASMSTMRI